MTISSTDVPSRTGDEKHASASSRLISLLRQTSWATWRCPLVSGPCAQICSTLTCPLTPGDALKAVLSAKPTTKADFNELSNNIIIAITSRHESNPLYSTFLEQFTKDLCANLNAVQTRKISSALSVLGNTKQQEERDKASGKKKVNSIS